MYCRECGENNPEDAVYCRNCGTKLKQDVKKTTVIETENINQRRNNTQTTQTTADTNKSSSKDDWKCCCGCLIAIFIIFALASLMH